MNAEYNIPGLCDAQLLQGLVPEEQTRRGYWGDYRRTLRTHHYQFSDSVGNLDRSAAGRIQVPRNLLGGYFYHKLKVYF